MEQGPPQNERRNRWYGLRPGDTVVQKAFGLSFEGVVQELHLMDNNGATIITDDGEMDVVCEWCEVLVPVEEK